MPHKSDSISVQILHGQAISYVWGWQDALGPAAKDTGYSVDFGEAYAEVARQYEAGKRGSRPTIQDAFAHWRVSRTIP